MKTDILVAEIGSTTTVVNAFDGILDKEVAPTFLGQGFAPTSVVEGDVTFGLSAAVTDLANRLGGGDITWSRFLATSSAAGGLKMTVHGLVYDMTVRAAREAALGAGANIHLVTAGKFRGSDLERIEKIRPNIVMIAGGVDYGERDTALYNARAIASLDLGTPVIYAGNIVNQDEIRQIFDGTSGRLYTVGNVYPKIDELDIAPARRVIQEVFEEHIVHAPGMERVRDMVDGSIIPTPGAVMVAAQILREELGDLVVVDVGGATTDVHSVASGSEEIARLLVSPEPESKRTVEGDLGVYINRKNIVDLIGIEQLSKYLESTVSEVEPIIDGLGPVPSNLTETQLVWYLVQKAAATGMMRHAGKLKDLYGPSGKITVAEGKDLTSVRYLVGTGGALTRIEGGRDILNSVRISGRRTELLPGIETEVLIDSSYIMASLGVLSREYPKKALGLLKESLQSKQLVK